MPTRQIDLVEAVEGLPQISIRLAWWFWPYVRLRLMFGPIEEGEMERIFDKAAHFVVGK